MKCRPDDDAERLKTARQDSGVARPSLFPRVILCVLLLAWIAGSGTTFASDEDPDLVKAAAPFSLKLMESLLAETPQHQGLLSAAASGFTQYAFAFVQQEADELEARDLAAAEALRTRARRLYLDHKGSGVRIDLS